MKGKMSTMVQVSDAREVLGVSDGFQGKSAGIHDRVGSEDVT